MERENANQHGDRYQEGGEEYMVDHLNGVDWHVPRERDPEDEYTAEDKEMDDWLNDY